MTPAPSRSASSTARSSSRRPRSSGHRRARRPAGQRADRLLPEHQHHDPDDVDRHGDRPGRLDPDGPRLELIPGRAQNVFEWFYEFLSDFGVGIAGAARQAVHPALRRVLPPHPVLQLERPRPAGRARSRSCARRRATSNITLGLALVSFVYFEFQGFRELGVGGYLGKFFPLYEFKNGVGAGLIALFVGLVELMLEFVKPVTLVDATLRQHLRRRGGAGRHHGPDHRLRAGRPARPGSHAQRRSRRSSSASSPSCSSSSRSRAMTTRRDTSPRRRWRPSTGRSQRLSPPLTRRGRTHHGPNDPEPQARGEEEDTRWSTSAPASPPSASSARASASASWPAWPPRPSAATPTRPARSAASRSSSRRSPKASASSRSSSACSRSSSSAGLSPSGHPGRRHRGGPRGRAAGRRGRG